MKKRNIWQEFWFRVWRRLDHHFGFIPRMLVYPLPRDTKMIVYGGAIDKFIDNNKYAFIHNNETMPEYRHIWQTRDKNTFKIVKDLGYEVEYSNSIRGIFHMLRAKFFVFDDYIGYFSAFHNLTNGGVRIELWHGIPLKYYCYAQSDKHVPYQEKGSFHEKFIETHINGDYSLSTTKRLNVINSFSFRMPLSRVFIGGYPRTKILLLGEDERRAFIKKYESFSTNQNFEILNSIKCRKIIYMPTFRDANPLYINKAIPDWDKLNSICKECNSIFYLKVHRATPLPDIGSYTNIKLLDNEMDVYPLLPLFDILITDYSSIMYDFSLMSKPLILYTYDIDEYASASRPLYEDFYRLRTRLTDTHDFIELCSLLKQSSIKTKRFPVDEYFDKPINYDAVGDLIRKLS